MVTIDSLWLPILLAAVAVFAVSSIMHMFLGYHWNDLRSPAQQDAMLDALRGLNVQPGDYAMPKPDSMKQCAARNSRPRSSADRLVLMTVSNGGMAMGKSLGQWFVYLLVVGVLLRVHRRPRAVHRGQLPGGVPPGRLQRLHGLRAGTAAGLDLVPAQLAPDLVAMFDGLVFAMLTGGMFGWLWPR